MKIRSVIFASVCSALLAASVAASGSALAAAQNIEAQKAIKAYQLLQAGDQQNAIIIYTGAIESRQLQTEALANALLNRGLAYQQLSAYQPAIDDYTAALQLDAMTADMRAMALYNRGLSQQKLNGTARAIEDFTSALFLKPNFAEAYYSRGNALRNSGQNLFALSDYDKALRYKHPDKALVRYSEALAYASLKRPAEEKASLNAALATNPDYAPALARLAVLNGQAPATVAAAPVIVTPVAAAPRTQVVAEINRLPAAIEPPASLMPTHAGDPLQTAAVDAPKPTEQDIQKPEQSKQIAKGAQNEEIVAVEPVEEPQQADSERVTDTPNKAQSEWAVQLASAGSEAAAWSTWKKMQAKHRVLAEQKVVVVKADLGNKGTFYRIRMDGFNDQTAAKSSCNKLKASGVSCFISKNNS